jgi:hypothetical protein
MKPSGSSSSSAAASSSAASRPPPPAVASAARWLGCRAGGSGVLTKQHEQDAEFTALDRVCTLGCLNIAPKIWAQAARVDADASMSRRTDRACACLSDRRRRAAEAKAAEEEAAEEEAAAEREELLLGCI